MSDARIPILARSINPPHQRSDTAEGKIVVARKLRRKEVLAFFAKLPLVTKQDQSILRVRLLENLNKLTMKGRNYVLGRSGWHENPNPALTSNIEARLRHGWHVGQ